MTWYECLEKDKDAVPISVYLKNLNFVDHPCDFSRLDATQFSDGFPYSWLRPVYKMVL